MKIIRETWACLIEDIAANKGNVSGRHFFGKLKALLYLLWFSPNFSCVFWFRFNQYLGRKNNIFSRYLCRRLSAKRIYKFGNDISCWAEIGSGFRIVHLSDIVIGRQSRVGKNFTVLNGVSLGEKNVSEKGMPSVGDNVYIGTGAKLLGNISIGDRVTIGAMTFCDKSVPADSVAYGNPMKIHNKTALK